MANPFEFLQQVRSEASKVVWPSRRETLITTGMVMLMVVFTSAFFLVVDEALRVVPRIETLLRQERDERSDLAGAFVGLEDAIR